jgi:hypothetical protein
MNTNFYGKVTVSMGSTKVNTGTLEGNFSTLTITNAASLGGKLEPYLVNEKVPFTYNALTLTKMSKLRVTAPNIVLPADSNRGMFISTYSGRIEVPESAGTLTVNWPITLQNGVHLYKEGAGHLILGNQLWFLNNGGSFLANEVTGASGEKYYIDIREGSVSATHCNAMNGAYIAFSNNVEMVMWADTTDANIRKHGIRLEKARGATPLATEMPIRLSASDINNFTESSYKIPLVTVKTAYAEDVASKLKVTLDIKGYRLADITSATSEVSRATTLYANILHNGLVISVR